MQTNPKLKVVRCSVCCRPKWRQHRHGDGFYIRLRLRGCCLCKGD